MPLYTGKFFSDQALIFHSFDDLINRIDAVGHDKIAAGTDPFGDDVSFALPGFYFRTAIQSLVSFSGFLSF